MTCIRTVLLYSSNDRSQIYMDKYGKLSLNCPCYPFFTKSTVTDVMFLSFFFVFNPTALGNAKIVHNFSLSECNRVKHFTQP